MEQSFLLYRDSYIKLAIKTQSWLSVCGSQSLEAAYALGIVLRHAENFEGLQREGRELRYAAS